MMYHLHDVSVGVPVVEVSDEGRKLPRATGEQAQERVMHMYTCMRYTHVLYTCRGRVTREQA